jgi:hypothetical protein
MYRLIKGNLVVLNHRDHGGEVALLEHPTRHSRNNPLLRQYIILLPAHKQRIPVFMSLCKTQGDLEKAVEEHRQAGKEALVLLPPPNLHEIQTHLNGLRTHSFDFVSRNEIMFVHYIVMMTILTWRKRWELLGMNLMMNKSDPIKMLSMRIRSDIRRIWPFMKLWRDEVVEVGLLLLLPHLVTLITTRPVLISHRLGPKNMEVITAMKLNQKMEGVSQWPPGGNRLILWRGLKRVVTRMLELQEAQVPLDPVVPVDSPQSIREVEDWMPICLSGKNSRVDFQKEVIF